jgi:hypothetical protein
MKNMRCRQNLAACLVLSILVLALPRGAFAISGTFTTFDVPDAGTGDQQGTLGVSINAAGAITGPYVPANNATHGFVRDKYGRFATFDPRGSNYTNPSSINAAGAITGYYREANNATHGFVRDGHGTLTTFDVPGSNLFTLPLSINAAGAIAGYFFTTDGVYHGFVGHKDGTLTTFEAPQSSFTIPSSINGDGAIAGYYRGANSVYHGFVLSSSPDEMDDRNQENDE